MELDCRQIDESLIDFLYGEIDDGDASAFEQHLRSCPKCAAAADQLRETRSLFSRLESAEPPPLGDADPLLVAAMAKADEMAASAERIAAAAAPAPPSLWARVTTLFRSAAFRPALGTAFMVVLVAGVGILFLNDRPTPRSEGASNAGEGLARVPSDELRASRPAPAPAASPARPASENEAPPAQREPAPVGPTKTLEDRSDGAERPPAKRATARPQRPAERGRSSRRNAPPSRLADLERPAAGATHSGPAAPLQDATSGPIMVEAERVGALRPGAEGAPDSRAEERPPALTMEPPASVMPTPPLPQAAPSALSASRRERQAAAQPQAPTPPPAGPTAVPGAGDGPIRVPTPGQRLYEQGMAAYRAGQYRDAADELNAFVRSPSAPRHLLPSGIHHLAMSQRRTGSLAAAARSYDQLIRGYQGYQRMPQAILEAAQVNARLGRYARAEALLRQLEANPAWSSRARDELARLRHRRAGETGRMGPAEADEAAGEAVFDDAAVEEPAAAPPGD